MHGLADEDQNDFIGITAETHKNLFLQLRQESCAAVEWRRERRKRSVPVP